MASLPPALLCFALTILLLNSACFASRDLVRIEAMHGDVSSVVARSRRSLLRPVIEESEKKPDNGGKKKLGLQQLKLLSKYMSNEEMASHIEGFTKRCSHIARSFSFGKSVKGVDMLALAISASAGAADVSMPSFKIASNMHGDEPSGRTLLLLLAEKLCEEYKRDPLVTRLVDNVHLVLIPTMNPDGFATKNRNNMNNVDLNRNFPDPILSPNGTDLRIPQQQQEIETRAIMNLTLAYNFVASLGLHEGALVANYPQDGYADGSQQSRKIKHACPDDATFMYMASKYANLHTTMATAKSMDGFKGGITNGAAWYPVYGGMQDWNYYAADCMDVTLELNDNKWPVMARLAVMWEENEKAFIEYPLAAVFTGFRGQVRSVGRKLSLEAAVHVQGIDKNVSSTVEGFYFRPLAPGTYTVTFSAPEYSPTTVTVEVPANNLGTVVDASLLPLPGTSAARADLLTPKVNPKAKPEVKPEPKPEEIRPAVVVTSITNNSQVESGFIIMDKKEFFENGQHLTYVFGAVCLVVVPVIAIAIYVSCVRQGSGQRRLYNYH